MRHRNGHGDPSEAPPSPGSMLLETQETESTTEDNVEMKVLASMPLMPLQGGTGYHPDYLFCGECTDCEDHPTSNDANSASLISSADIITSEPDEGGGEQRTKILVDNLDCPSHILIIQSVLKELPGVTKVIVKLQDQLVFVDHDAATTPDDLIHTLKEMNYYARLQPSNTASTLTQPQQHQVRSQLFVQGICCASECPSIQKIVKPLPGVTKLQINITTKMIYVHHDPAQLDVHEIAMALHSQGFEAKVYKDGAVGKKMSATVGRTTLHAVKVLSTKDIRPIQLALAPLEGVKRVGVNVSESVIYVEHDVSKLTAEKIHKTLQPMIENEIAFDAADDIAQRTSNALKVARSKFVESTLVLTNLTLSHLSVLEKCFSQNYIRAQLRAFYPHVPSKTMKIEHDPRLLQADAVATLLGRYGMQASVVADGAIEHLALPLMEEYETPKVYGGMEGVSASIHMNVVWSGLFWFLSMLSAVGGNWEYLKYFGLLSVLFGLPPIAMKAFRTIRRCQFDSNCMMVAAALGALALQEFDEAASVSFLFAVSEFLESRASAKARRALSAIVSLRPEHANVIHPVTKEVVIIPADKVPVGSRISVKTGDKVAADGVVVEGSSTMDESSLTGESAPVVKHVDDVVSGGSINIGSTQLIVRTTTSVEDSAVSRLIRLVEEAQANRSPTEKLVDAFSRTYTPFVVLGAALMCTVPWFFSRELGRYWTLNGLIIIVIACPCALTISTPVTYAAGLAACAQRGIIVKGGAHLEALGSVKKMVFDKTGTLTKGNFSVIHLESVGDKMSRSEMLQTLALVEAPSSHPLSATLVNAARKEGVSVPRDSSVKNHTILKGEGVTALINDRHVYVGNKRLFTRLGFLDTIPQKYLATSHDWERWGGTVGFVGIEGLGIVGMFCVSDTVREEAKEVVTSLLDSGIDVIMLTGDGEGAARAVAKQIGLPDSAVHSQLLPEDKLHFIGGQITPPPKHCGPCRPKKLLLMVGDGVNDAPALAVADVGVAMGEGAALAMEMSDITLMDSNLSKLLYCIKMGNKVIRTIQENIVFSLAAKIAVVVLTFLGKMTLLYAIAADVGMMLIVTLNGMKLLPSSKEPNFQKEWGGTMNGGPRYNQLSTSQPEVAVGAASVVQSVKTVADYV